MNPFRAGQRISWRDRAHPAPELKESANVLLLDEPTSNLDVNTMRALEEAFEGFSGCIAVISHDRWFLDRIATHILAFEGDSRVVWLQEITQNARQTGDHVWGLPQTSRIV